MGVFIYIVIALLASGLVVLCVFMLKKEIKDRKNEKLEKEKEKAGEQLEADVKEAISKRV